MFIRRQPALDPNRLVFIDETWAATNMTRHYGRCARGLRLRASVPHGHWKLTTLVAGLRTAGISVPSVFDGAINGLDFPPWSGGVRSERHAAARMVIPSMLARASAGVR